MPSVAPNYCFVNKNFDEQIDYDKGFAINELFPLNVVGIATAKDAVLINENLSDLYKNVENYFNVVIDKKLTKKIAYRPFDTRNIYYDVKIVERAREKIMQHFIKGENVALISNKQIRTSHIFHHWITKTLTDLHITETANANPYIFPLYLYPETTAQQTIGHTAVRTPNLNMEIVNKIVAGVEDLEYNPDATTVYENILEGFPFEFGPLDLLDYIYAVLHSPTYRDKYKEFLKIDFPRVPYPTNRYKFWNWLGVVANFVSCIC